VSIGPEVSVSEGEQPNDEEMRLELVKELQLEHAEAPPYEYVEGGQLRH
jgi:hypothetical protein